MTLTPGTRNGAIARAQRVFDSGTYIATLAELVSVPTQSDPPTHKHELDRYCNDCIGPIMQGLGFDYQVLDNPEREHGPILVAYRKEHEFLPTVLVYGHGDVVRPMQERWRSDLDPWKLTVEGDRIYGRGVVDNKGQHLVAIESLRAVMQERGGQLGFNVKVMIETGEEAGSPGLYEFLKQHEELCSADVFIALDGPRQSFSVPDITLGTRGCVSVDLVVDLRAGSHHSGHWGGC